MWKIVSVLIRMLVIKLAHFFFLRVKGEQIIYPARQKKYKKVKLKFVIISSILGNYYSTTLREAN